MKTANYLLMILSLFLFAACEKESTAPEPVNDVFYLSHNDAEMPVFVKGNTASNTFILWLHGGPGSSCFPQKYGDYSIMKSMEEKYANVYWDQRCAGNSRGTFNPQDLSIPVMVEDLEKLLVLIRHRYGSDITLILLGHSWGGTLGYSFLAKDSNQDQVDGYLCVSGPHNTSLLMRQQKKETLDLAHRQIALGNCVSGWEEVVQSLEELDENDKDNFLPMNGITHSASEYLVEVDSINPASWSWLSLSNILRTPNIEMAWVNKNISGSSPLEKQLHELELSDALASIRLPVLFMSGKYDMAVTASQLEEACSIIGSTKKEHVVFQRSAHASYISEPEDFLKAVNSFIESL